MRTFILLLKLSVPWDWSVRLGLWCHPGHGFFPSSCPDFLCGHSSQGCKIGIQEQMMAHTSLFVFKGGMKTLLPQIWNIHSFFQFYWAKCHVPIGLHKSSGSDYWIFLCPRCKNAFGHSSSFIHH